MLRHLRPVVSALLLAASACGDDGRREDSSPDSGASSISVTANGGTATGEPPTTPTTGDEASTGGTAGGGATSDATPGGEDPKFDLGVTPDGGLPSEPQACVKVDLLFVIDNSSSMKNEQDNLVASFPGFVTEMQEQLKNADSYHVGVVSSDAYNYNEDPCDDKLGALITRTGGDNSSDALCGPYASGQRYMNEMDDLGTRFGCAAQVGTDGASNEKPIEAALRAVGPELGAAGQCNEGFLRQDALLVLVVITDEEEEGSSGDPSQWFDQLVALKGTETNIVVLSLIGPENPECQSAAEIAYRIVDFTERFTYGSIGQICADTFQPFFKEAIGVINEACDNFSPPG